MNDTPDPESTSDLPVVEPVEETPVASKSRLVFLKDTLNATPDIQHDDAEIGESAMDKLAAAAKAAKERAAATGAGAPDTDKSEKEPPPPPSWHFVLQSHDLRARIAVYAQAERMTLFLDEIELEYPKCWYVHPGVVMALLSLSRKYYAPSRGYTMEEFFIDFDRLIETNPWKMALTHRQEGEHPPVEKIGMKKDGEIPTLDEYISGFTVPGPLSDHLHQGTATSSAESSESATTVESTADSDPNTAS